MLALVALSLLQISSTQFILASATDCDGRPLVGLQADDLVVQENGERRAALDASPALYPVAVLVDDTLNARADFVQIRSALEQFVVGLTGREVALYSFSDRATRVVDFTGELGVLERAARGLFARPDGESYVLDAIVEAARDLERRKEPVAAIIVLSAGGSDRSSRTARDVTEPVLRSHSVLHVVEMRSARPSGRQTLEEVLRGLAERTQGQFTVIHAASGFGATLRTIRERLESELVVEYAAGAAGSSPRLEIGVRVPCANVRAVRLDRALRK
ncbi:MAG: VWA domain-containing protein [Vicinamibacterales bacterium]